MLEGQVRGMKKLVVCTLIAVIVLIAVGLAGANAAARELSTGDTLEVCILNGADGVKYTVYDKSSIRLLKSYIGKQSAKKIQEADTVSLDYPYIGFYQGHESGFWAAYSNGFWICGDGTVYKIELDVERITDILEGAGKSATVSASAFPNRFVTSAIGGEWNTALLTPAERYIFAKSEYDAEIIAEDAKSFTVRIENPTDTELLFHEEAVLEVLPDGEWYIVPVNVPNYGHVLTETKLQPGEAMDFTLHVNELIENTYGALPEGEYRIVYLSCCYDFTV